MGQPTKILLLLKNQYILTHDYTQQNIQWAEKGP